MTTNDFFGWIRVFLLLRQVCFYLPFPKCPSGSSICYRKGYTWALAANDALGPEVGTVFGVVPLKPAIIIDVP